MQHIGDEDVLLNEVEGSPSSWSVGVPFSLICAIQRIFRCLLLGPRNDTKGRFGCLKSGYGPKQEVNMLECFLLLSMLVKASWKKARMSKSL